MANALRKGTFSSEDVTKYLPGDNFSRCKTGSVKAATLKKNKTGDPSQQFALVYFIGGEKRKKNDSSSVFPEKNYTLKNFQTLKNCN